MIRVIVQSTGHRMKRVTVKMVALSFVYMVL